MTKQEGRQVKKTEVMWTRLAIFLTLCAFADVVSSDSCNSYNILSDASRSIMKNSSGCARYDDYLSGWYRFMGDAGDMMIDYCPSGYNRYACGAHFKGWLAGGHPEVYEGEVDRTVYFYNPDYYSCHYFSQSIQVRNCGRFFVYRLPRIPQNCAKYCGNGRNYTSSTIMPSSPSTRISSSSVSASSSRNYKSSTIMPSSSSISISPTPVLDSCNSYNILSDASRSIMKNSSGCTGYDNYLNNGWYRFMGDAGDMMIDYCPSGFNNYACGAYYKGWLGGGHPEVYEGEVYRTVYFYNPEYNWCHYYSQSIKVRNCGRFFVYRLQRTSWRWCAIYCGNGRNYNSSTIMPSSSSISTTSTPVSEWYTSSIFMSSSAAVLQNTTTAPTKSDDGCTQYQLLSDPTRAITYGDWSYRRCDDKLYGWYRFTGDAGNRMLDYCPLAVSGSRYNRCGARFQGWITSGSMPRIHEGEVSRLVCFSDSNSCRCQYQTQIKVRNCGKFYVYWLKGVPTCHQRYCGVKDQSAVVSCSQNYMRIELDRNFFNASAYSSITLKDPRCRASTSYSHINLGTIPSQCGSQRKETYDYIIYENEVIMKAKPTTGLITRESDMRIRLSCSYNKNGFVSFVSFKPVTTINVTEAAYGNFTYYFRMYTDSSYRMVHSHFPAQVKLRDWLYFEAYASVSDTKLVVLIEQCYSTPTMDRNHPDKYVFINERCPADKTVQFFSASANRQRFSLQAYKYVQNSTAVYIHCVVFICHQSSKHGRCRTGCSGNNVNRVRRDLEGGSGYTRNEEGYSKFYLVEAGPITLDRGKEILQGKKGTKSIFSTTSLLLIVGVAVLVIVVAALIIKMRRSNTAAGNKQLEVGIDHAPNGQEYVITGEDPPSPGLNEDEKKEEAV